MGQSKGIESVTDKTWFAYHKDLLCPFTLTPNLTTAEKAVAYYVISTLRNLSDRGRVRRTYRRQGLMVVQGMFSTRRRIWRQDPHGDPDGPQSWQDLHRSGRDT